MVDLDNRDVTSIFYFWSRHSGYLDNGENVNKRFSIRLSLLYSSPHYFPSVISYFFNVSPTKENINEGNVANYPRIIRSLGNRLCGCIEPGIGTPQRSISLLAPWYVMISSFHQTSNFLCKSPAIVDIDYSETTTPLGNVRTKIDEPRVYVKRQGPELESLLVEIPIVLQWNTDLRNTAA